MAKTKTTKSIVEEVEEIASDMVEKYMDENDKKNTKKTVEVEPLNDSDEIEVVSLIPNVSYKDSKTLDMYEWDEVGHIEYMTFDTLKNMWRNNKGYFKNMWLKPNDDRVINKFGLTKTFKDYEYLMDESNYTKKNIDTICKSISNTPNGLKRSIYNKIKDLVVKEKITDINVIKKLGRHLNVDLTDFI